MRLSRQEAVECLTDEESMGMHGLTVIEVRQMATEKLSLLVNRIFESIDLEDPYVVYDHVRTPLSRNSLKI
jgi:hypothetical protein